MFLGTVTAAALVIWSRSGENQGPPNRRVDLSLVNIRGRLHPYIKSTPAHALLLRISGLRAAPERLAVSMNREGRGGCHLT
ncbi:hypothetical protein ACIBL6_20170 [Streptomyces sp. NPDC050400]|uniref:hypothetical protein n=1 Tax=Streptomyces sp. NPDC050400 TaxID=3365610 RepID=UPI0037A17B78